MIYPEILFLLFPLALFALFIKYRPQKSFIHPKLIISSSAQKESLLLLVAALLLIALARPGYEGAAKHKEPIHPIFVAIDLSHSMQATDVAPNRLQRALQIARELIERTHQKIALLVFTQNPLLIAPPTNDKEMLMSALEAIDPKNILTKGTNFQKLLDFVHRFEGKKDLVIISDGGEFDKLKLYDDTTIYAIAVGSNKGALVPTDDGYLKDAEGKLVVSRINPNFLKIAKEYAINEAGDFHFDHRAQKLQKKEFVDLFYTPLFLAILLVLFIYTSLFDRFKKFIPLLLLTSLHASIIDELNLQKGYDLYAKGHYKDALTYFEPTTLQGAYARAKTFEKLGEYPKAIKLLQSIKTTDAKLKARILTNIARDYEKLKKFDAARKAYIEAMQLEPTKERLQKIKELAFKHNAKKVLLPFAKQKITQNRSKSGDKGKKSKKSASKLASSGGGAKGSNKKKSQSIARSKAMPLGSRVYELINKGYIDEKNPW